ncbi:MAG: hypothetical protein NTU63_00700 [Candidatus Pacearchaeota archaeon]|nr:hypothetical protein [Candidatus Pacearchaeota archaeon]
MYKRFLQACKNPECNQEFGILYEKIEEGGIKMARCPHCKRLHKIKLPSRKKSKKKGKNKVKKR